MSKLNIICSLIRTKDLISTVS